MTRSILTVLTAMICTLAATQARADTRVTVHDFYGPNAGRLRDDVVNLLERQSGVTIISTGQIESSAIRLGVDPYSPDGRMALSRELQLSAWMSGIVKKQSGKLKLTVVVHDGAQHALIGRTSLRGSSVSKLAGEIRDRLWKKSRRAILRALPPAPSVDADPAVAAKAAETDTAAEQKAPDTDSADNESESETGIAANETAPETVAGASPQATDDEVPFSIASSNLRDDGVGAETRGNDATGSHGRGESLRAFIGLGSPYRSLAYNDPITTSLADYQLSGAPMVDLNVAFHPARPFTDGWVSWIGLDLGAQIATATTSVDRDGSKFSSQYAAYHVGLRGRMPLGAHYLSIFSGYAMNSFSITSETAGAQSQTPSVDYRTIRTGVGAEFALSDTMMLGVEGAWLQSLSVGEIAKWFPRSTAAGIELGMFATYKLTEAVFARASGTYQRTGFDFNSKPGDLKVAGGATDQYLAMSLGAGVRL